MPRKPPYLIRMTIAKPGQAARDILLSRKQMADRFPEWVELADHVRRTGQTASVHCDEGQAWLARSGDREEPSA